MTSLQFDAGPYTFNAVSLIIIGVTSALYLLRLKGKPAVAWLVLLGLVCFTASMAAMMLTNLVLWGKALAPFTDAWSVASMAVTVEFAYRYPTRIDSIQSRLVRGLALAAGLLSMAISIYSAYQILAVHNYGYNLPTAFWFLNPVT
ncbi:MAG: hypothetical protein GYA17_21440, partial [Chloroflexi bacterium]|nr:hypothetical protein [Chloroflexota bacterium]